MVSHCGILSDALPFFIVVCMPGNPENPYPIHFTVVN